MLPIEEQAALQADIERDNRRCFFRELGYTGCGWRFDGNSDPAHLIPAQRIKRVNPAVAFDPRVIVPACRIHHNAFDMKSLRLGYDQYPESVLDFAAQHGWWFAGPRDGWLPEAPIREAA